MNVSLTPQLEAFIRRKVASGLYNNASEVVREALPLLVARLDAESRVEPPVPPGKDAVRATLASLEVPLRERGIVSLALFGSVARGEARTGSDIDVLVDIDPEARFSLVDLVTVENFLAEYLGYKVDVVTREGIDPAIRDRVLDAAEPVS